MCGIVGGYGEIEPESVRRMMGRIAHRGPDDDGLVRVGGNTLGHRRLSIVDVEGGKQPLATRDGNLHLVGNGEVYNHEEILETLDDRAMTTRSDNEVALRLVAERGPDALAELLGARKVPVPPAVLRIGAAATWKLRLQPSPPGWVDMALGTPLMDTRRAREELGWEPRFSSGEALLDLIAGIRDSAGADTPPLDPSTGGPLRLRELATGVGRVNP